MKFFILLLSISVSALAIDWQGHRGARGLYPENTIGAMEEALKYPVTTLELDVVVSKDQQVVVSHEPWMSDEICIDEKGKKVEGKKHNLFKMTYDEIQKFDCGSVVHPRFTKQQKAVVGKPLLSNLIAATEPKLQKLDRRKIQYNIEIKSTVEDEKEGYQPDYKTFSDLVIKEIKSKLPVNRFTIQSFDWRVLKYIHAAYPDVRLVALLEGDINPDHVIKELGFHPYVFSPYFPGLTKKIIAEFHSKKIKVIPWTVNEVKDMEVLVDMGVDGIITDYPNLIQEVVSKKCGLAKHLFEGKCITIPAHAVSSLSAPGWDCEHGYIQKRISCVEITVPKNAHLTEDGKSWKCDDGFKRYRSSCKN